MKTSTLFLTALLVLGLPVHSAAETAIKTFWRNPSVFQSAAPPSPQEEVFAYRYVIDRVEGITELLQKNCVEASPCLSFGPLVRAAKESLGGGGMKIGSEPFNRRLEMKFLFPEDPVSAVANSSHLEGCRRMFQMKMAEPARYRLEVSHPVSDEAHFTCEISVQADLR
jgi:hypothetical protein